MSSRMFPYLRAVAIAVGFALAGCGVMYGTSLTGTISNPDGTGFTGQLQMTLAQQGSLVSTGGCGGPAEIVPSTKYITVTSGSLIGSPTVYGNDCMLPNGIYYNVVLVDPNGNNIMVDKWVIQGSTINVGTIVSVVITGTTATLGGVTVIQGTPNGSQTITQPPSTILNVNLLGVTTQLTLPDGSTCTTTDCTFQNTVGFIQGINTGTTQPSYVYIGGAGNFWNRTLTSLPTGSCTGVLDGWMAVNTALQEIYLCIGGHLYATAPLTFVF